VFSAADLLGTSAFRKQLDSLQEAVAHMSRDMAALTYLTVTLRSSSAVPWDTVASADSIPDAILPLLLLWIMR